MAPLLSGMVGLAQDPVRCAGMALGDSEKFAPDGNPVGFAAAHEVHMDDESQGLARL